MTPEETRKAQHVAVTALVVTTLHHAYSLAFESDCMLFLGTYLYSKRSVRVLQLRKWCKSEKVKKRT